MLAQPFWQRLRDRVSQTLGLREQLQLLERVVLDLADPLTSDAEGATHLLERARRLARESVAKLDHAPLTFGKRVERALDVLAAEVHRGRVKGRRRVLVAHEVAEGRLVFLADRLLERDRHL